MRWSTWRALRIPSLLVIEIVLSGLLASGASSRTVQALGWIVGGAGALLLGVVIYQLVRFWRNVRSVQREIGRQAE